MKKTNLFLIIWLICSCVTVNAQNYVKTALGIKTRVNAIDIEIQFFTPKIVRIIKSPAGINNGLSPNIFHPHIRNPHI